MGAAKAGAAKAGETIVCLDATLRVEIFPADLAATIDFYHRLGFEAVGGSDGYASLRYGAVRIGASESEPVDSSLRAVPAGTEIVIDVDDVRAVRDLVVGNGIELAADLVTRPWGLTDFRVNDPDGYYLRFTGRRES